MSEFVWITTTEETAKLIRTLNKIRDDSPKLSKRSLEAFAIVENRLIEHGQRQIEKTWTTA